MPQIPFYAAQAIHSQSRPWGSIPRINWQHPLARGMVFYCYGTSNGYVELVQGGVGKLLVGTNHMVQKITPYGSGLASQGVNAEDGVAIPLAGGNAKVKTFGQAAPYGVAMGIFCSAVGPSGDYGTCLGDTTTTDDSLGFGSNGTNVAFLAGNGTSLTAFSNAFKANTFQSYAVNATSGTTLTLYYNGKQDSTATVSATTAAFSSSQVLINTNSATTPNFNGALKGVIFYWAGWNRLLSAFEANWLHVDPYSMLIYPEDEAFVTLTGNPAAFVGSQAQNEWRYVYRSPKVIGGSPQ